MKYKPLLAMALVCGAIPKVALAEDAFFDSKGVKIWYVTAGEGEAVVLIHGWMSDSSMWGHDASGNTQLDTDGAKGFKIIALDCRGHGKSDKLYDPSKYGAAMADDVVRLLDHLKIKKAHLVGYSMGAFIVGKIAADHPGRVLSIIYGGQAPLIVGEKSTNGPGEVDIFAKAVNDNDLGTYLMAVWPADMPKPTPELAKAYAKMLYGGKDVKAFAAAGRSFGDLAVTPRGLRRCKAPVMFIYGANDISRDRIVSVQKILGRGEVKVVPNADHSTTLINPEFGKSVVDFLQAHQTK